MNDFQEIKEALFLTLKEGGDLQAIAQDQVKRFAPLVAEKLPLIAQEQPHLIGEITKDLVFGLYEQIVNA